MKHDLNPRDALPPASTQSVPQDQAACIEGSVSPLKFPPALLRCNTLSSLSFGSLGRRHALFVCRTYRTMDGWVAQTDGPKSRLGVRRIAEVCLEPGAVS